MLEIRDDQQSALTETQKRDVDRRLLAHVKSAFPAQTAGRSDDELLGQIAKAQGQAQRHELTAERDLYALVNVAVLLDSEPESDSTWAAEMLSDSSIDSPRERLNRVVKEAEHRLAADENNASIEHAFYQRAGEGEADADEAAADDPVAEPITTGQFVAASDTARAQSDRDRTSGIVECPTEDDWIEIQLVGEDDAPIADERCVVIDPDERRHRCRTDAEGLIRVEKISAGTCRISFPDLDRRAWEPHTNR